MRNSCMRRAMLVSLVSFCLVSPTNAFTLVTWNAEQASVESVTRREPTLAKLGETLKASNAGALPDILVLQEITSWGAAARIARALGYANATLAVTIPVTTGRSGRSRSRWRSCRRVRS